MGTAAAVGMAAGVDTAAEDLAAAADTVAVAAADIAAEEEVVSVAVADSEAVDVAAEVARSARTSAGSTGAACSSLSSPKTFTQNTPPLRKCRTRRWRSSGTLAGSVDFWFVSCGCPVVIKNPSCHPSFLVC